MPQQQELMYPQVLDVKEADDGSGDLIVKSFMISSDVNINGWWVKPQALEKHVEGFTKTHSILHPSKDHPDYSAEGVTFGASDTYQQMLKAQEKYIVGPIFKVERRTDMAYGWDCYQRIKNPALKQLYRAGAFPKFVSPMVYSPTPVDGTKGLDYFEPLHLAYVDDPAYGAVATVKGHCLSADQHCLTNLHAAKTIQKKADGTPLCQKGVLLTFKNLYQASDLHSYYFDNHTKNNLESKLVDETNKPTNPADNDDKTPKAPLNNEEENKNKSAEDKNKEGTNDTNQGGNKSDPSKNLNNTPEDGEKNKNTSGKDDNSSTGKDNIKSTPKEDDFESKLQKSETFQKLMKKNEELEAFKKNSEEEKTRAEGAKKLQLIETYVNEATIPDPTTRKERIDKIKDMDINGDSLKFFLQEAYGKKLERATVKGASVDNKVGITRLIFGASKVTDNDDNTEVSFDAKDARKIADLF